MSKLESGRFYSVYFHDEWTQCGSGWRKIYLASVGRRYATVRDPVQLIGKRIKLDIWNGIAGSAKPTTVLKTCMYRRAHAKAKRNAEARGVRMTKIIVSAKDQKMIDAGS